MKASSAMDTGIKVLVSVFALTLVANAVIFALSIPVGIYTIFFTRLSAQYSPASVLHDLTLYLGPYFVNVSITSQYGTLFLVLSAVYVLLLIVAARQGTGIRESLGNSRSDGFTPLFKNGLFIAIIATGFIVFTTSVMDTIETSANIPIGSISGDPLQLMLGLTVAPLREEIGFRVFPIGLMALIMAIGRHGVNPFRAIWRPSAAFKAPVTRAERVVVLSVLLLSSVLFGLAHVSGGGTWQIGKLPEAAYAGLVLGYLYIRYGLHVPILAHWGVNYLGSVFAFLGQGAFGIPWDGASVFYLQQMIEVDFLLVLGPMCTALVGYRAIRALSLRRTGQIL